jgi:hypothetical protein
MGHFKINLTHFSPIFYHFLLWYLQIDRYLESILRYMLWNFLSFAKLFQIPLQGDAESKKAALQLPPLIRS